MAFWVVASSNIRIGGRQMANEDAHIACLHCQLGNVAYRVGDTLIFDSESEPFLDCEAGNKMMTRDYREGFEVPEVV